MARMYPNAPVRKPIADLIEELRSWLPNYDHGPTDYPTLLWRILASAPGGDEAEDMGYEPFTLGWHEIEQLGRVLEAIQDQQDVSDLVDGLMRDENEETQFEVVSKDGRVIAHITAPDSDAAADIVARGIRSKHYPRGAHVKGPRTDEARRRPPYPRSVPRRRR